MHFSVTQLLVILAIVIVVFGTKRLRNVGADLGGAIKSFRSAMKEGEDSVAESKEKIIDGEVTAKKKEEV
ncbi:MAG: Sec-independent protein translocase subunit TatA [Methylococcales bacterium]